MLKCLEIAGRDTVKARAISPAGRVPVRNRSRTARRVGSAKALNAVPGVAVPFEGGEGWAALALEYVTDR